MLNLTGEEASRTAPQRQVINSEIRKGAEAAGESQLHAGKEMMSGKFVTLDLKSMLLEGDIIVVRWKKNKYGEIKADTVKLHGKKWVDNDNVKQLMELMRHSVMALKISLLVKQLGNLAD